MWTNIGSGVSDQFHNNSLCFDYTKNVLIFIFEKEPTSHNRVWLIVFMYDMNVV